MPKYGIYDRGQKEWLHIYKTLQEAEEKFLHLDVKTAIISLYEEFVHPAEPEAGAPNEPQVEVPVVLPPAPEPTPPDAETEPPVAA